MLGKFYHRPPGGESWCDVILRLRSALDTIALHHGGARVLIVAHQVVVLCLRYLLEGMTEDADPGDRRRGRRGELRASPNTPSTRAQGRDGGLVLRRYNFVAPLQRARRAGHRASPTRRSPPDERRRRRSTAELLRGHARCRATARARTRTQRGRVLVIGGSVEVPGGALLAGLAALRAGAGKLQIAHLPQRRAASRRGGAGGPGHRPGGNAGRRHLRQRGRTVWPTHCSRCDAVLLGPGMMDGDAARALTAAPAGRGRPAACFVLDAAALQALRQAAGDRCGAMPAGSS